ncbi:MAG: hypothetical protein KDJ73_13495, partial [Notoacmeibacter sp.]|nr:hypothetical protein [Notoacmeibacter sp.]
VRQARTCRICQQAHRPPTRPQAFVRPGIPTRLVIIITVHPLNPPHGASSMTNRRHAREVRHEEIRRRLLVGRIAIRLRQR